jgi:hypothetical protein
MNNSKSDNNILRIIAISALAVAFIVTILIITNSGILGDEGTGSGADSADPAVTPAEVDPTAADQGAPTTEAPAEGAGDAPVDDSAPITLETETYVVEGGDSFFSIATRFGTTIDELLRLNPAVNPQNLKPGTELVVPRSEAAEE